MTSAYYQGVMANCDAMIAVEKTKYTQYEQLCTLIGQLCSSISSVQTAMTNCETKFLDGGYRTGGKSLSDGTLPKEAERLNETKEHLETSLKKAKLKMIDIKEKIRHLEAQRAAAEAAYISAKARGE